MYDVAIDNRHQSTVQIGQTIFLDNRGPRRIVRQAAVRVLDEEVARRHNPLRLRLMQDMENEPGSPQRIIEESTSRRPERAPCHMSLRPRNIWNLDVIFCDVTMTFGISGPLNQ